MKSTHTSENKVGPSKKIRKKKVSIKKLKTKTKCEKISFSKSVGGTVGPSSLSLLPQGHILGFAR